jgi:2-polyprenyl-6-methoxyphenol hydroxylase-like FAD-dependent oxidoreductase
MKAIIIGAGIGGLTTALMLHSRGIDCEVFEQSPAIHELGVGINVLPIAIGELAELGLIDALDKVAIRTRELVYMTRRGQQVWHEARGLDAGFEHPQFSIHRGRLQAVIARAVFERLGSDRVHLGQRLQDFQQDARGVQASFIDARGQPGMSVSADLLIGADGIHSTVRSHLFPQEGPPSWGGLMLWRGATDWPAFQDGKTMLIAGGLGAKAVVYPIATGAHDGERLTNWAILSRIGEAGTPPPRKQDWSRPGEREELMSRVGAFMLPQVDIAALIAATAEFWEYPMCDRDPLPRWSHGRITLLGDAAHPMYPVGSNGASQAILDSRCLADELSKGEVGISDALARYEADRLPKTAAIVISNRSGGPEGVIDAVEALAPDGFADIEAVLPLEERRKIVQGATRLSSAAAARPPQP